MKIALRPPWKGNLHLGSKDRLSMPYELSDKGAPTSPHCPACAQTMRLARITSRFGDLPDLYTFECRACGVSHIEAATFAATAQSRPLIMARIK